MIENNINRIGKFTSSQVYRLMGTPAVKKTYLKEVELTRKLGRDIELHRQSEEAIWGLLMEHRIVKILNDFSWEHNSQTTTLHPVFGDFWSGSADLIKAGTKIGEMKAYHPKHFALLAECLKSNSIEVLKDNEPSVYWQSVSNAIIQQVPKAEILLYLPYFEELDEIQEMALNIINNIEQYPNLDLWKVKSYVVDRPKEFLPYLPKGGYFQNLETFEFTIPQEDIDKLTVAIIEANQLIDYK